MITSPFAFLLAAGLGFFAPVSILTAGAAGAFLFPLQRGHQGRGFSVSQHRLKKGHRWSWVCAGASDTGTEDEAFGNGHGRWGLETGDRGLAWGGGVHRIFEIIKKISRQAPRARTRRSIAHSVKTPPAPAAPCRGNATVRATRASEDPLPPSHPFPRFTDHIAIPPHRRKIVKKGAGENLATVVVCGAPRHLTGGRRTRQWELETGHWGLGTGD